MSSKTKKSGFSFTIITIITITIIVIVVIIPTSRSEPSRCRWAINRGEKPPGESWPALLPLIPNHLFTLPHLNFDQPSSPISERFSSENTQKKPCQQGRWFASVCVVCRDLTNQYEYLCSHCSCVCTSKLSICVRDPLRDCGNEKKKGHNKQNKTRFIPSQPQAEFTKHLAENKKARAAHVDDNDDDDDNGNDSHYFDDDNSDSDNDDSY